MARSALRRPRAQVEVPRAPAVRRAEVPPLVRLPEVRSPGAFWVSLVWLVLLSSKLYLGHDEEDGGNKIFDKVAWKRVMAEGFEECTDLFLFLLWIPLEVGMKSLGQVFFVWECTHVRKAR